MKTSRRKDFNLTRSFIQGATTAYQILVAGTVPAGKMWYITTISAYNETGPTVRVEVYVNHGGTKYRFKRGRDLPKATFLEFTGDLWLDEGESLEAYFYRCAIDDGVHVIALGGVITK